MEWTVGTEVFHMVTAPLALGERSCPTGGQGPADRTVNARAMPWARVQRRGAGSTRDLCRAAVWTGLPWEGGWSSCELGIRLQSEVTLLPAE